MSELTDWLRAQIADDERGAHEDHALACGLLDIEPTDNVDHTKWLELCDCKVRRRLDEARVKRRMLDELHPELDRADRALISEWGTSSDLAETLLELLVVPYAGRPGCKREWLPSTDLHLIPCTHPDAYDTIRMDGSQINWCPDCGRREMLRPAAEEQGRIYYSDGTYWPK